MNRARHAGCGVLLGVGIALVLVQRIAAQHPEGWDRFEAAARAGNFAAAAAAGQACLTAYEHGRDYDLDDEVDLAMEIAIILTGLGAESEAKPFMDKGMALADRHGPGSGKAAQADAYATLGIAQIRANQLKAGCATMKRAGTLYDQLPNKDEKSDPTVMYRAMCSMAGGDFADAATQFEKAKASGLDVAKLMGAETAVPMVSLPLFLAQWRSGNLAKAQQALEDASMNWSDVITLWALRPAAEETRARSVGAGLAFMPSAATAFHFQQGANNPELARIAVEAILRYKGVLLETSTRFLQAMRESRSPAEQDKLRQVLDLRTQRAQRADALRNQDQDAAADQQMREWLAKENSVLQSLPASSRPGHRPTLQEVQAKLPGDAALIEFVRYGANFQEAMRRPDQEAPAPPPLFHYAAYVIVGGRPLRWAELGPADAIDEQVREYRRRIRDQDPDYAQPARLLFKALIAPLEADLVGIRRVMVSPDGALNLLPMAALIGPDADYWGRNVAISYLVSGRDLLAPSSTSASGPPVIIGAPTASAGQAPLPGMKEEAEEIHQLFPDARIYLGPDATLTHLRAVPSPRILHIAAHGSFAPAVSADGPKSSTDPLSDALINSTITLSPDAATHAAGPVTALEMAGLDLRGTKLVVLSACETGVGAASSGDGVYGLRRALVLAGARAQLLTLWKADDNATRTFMKAFYTKVKACGTIASALHDGQEAVRAQWKHPYYWAGFMVTGTSEQAATEALFYAAELLCTRDYAGVRPPGHVRACPGRCLRQDVGSHPPA